ncbi:MAG: hypothetical protein P9M14_17255 [Candidatus Alcyoniella australis]|nr:hypothetical protein [Candidatus Alcyoniella australis]
MKHEGTASRHRRTIRPASRSWARSRKFFPALLLICLAIGLLSSPALGDSSPGETYFVLAKFLINSDPEPLWDMYFSDSYEDDSEISLALDSSGNSFTSRCNDYNSSLMSVSADGGDHWQLWINELVYDLLPAPQGGVITTGNSDEGWMETCSYDQDGNLLWTAIPDHRSAKGEVLVADADDYFFALGQRTYGQACRAVKYDYSGNQQWLATIQGYGDYCQPEDAAVDHEGNLYFTGLLIDESDQTGFITLKYSADGVEEWGATYDSGPGNDYGSAIAVDNQGNTYVTGMDDKRHCNTLKYDPNGDLLWSDGFYLNNGEDRGSSKYYTNQESAMALDDQGNAYVTGPCCESDDNNVCMALVKYNPDGELQWSEYLPETSYLTRSALSLSPDGDLIILGGEYLGYLRYSTDGELLETISYLPNLDFSYMGLNALTVDDQSHVYVAGTIYMPDQGGEDDDDIDDDDIDDDDIDDDDDDDDDHGFWEDDNEDVDDKDSGCCG